MFLAAREVLESNRPLSGAEGEFLQLARFVEEASVEYFTRVWRDPFAYWWSRLAVALVESCLHDREPPAFSRGYVASVGGGDVRAACQRHLNEFKRLSLGLALAGGHDLQLPSPLKTASPVALPGTRFSAVGNPEVEVAGVSGGKLVDAAGEEVEVRPCPVVQDSGLDWRLQPEAWRLPELGLEIPDEALAPGYQESLVPLAQRSLQLIARYQPNLLPFFEASCRVIGFKPLSLGGYTNATHSELPGSFICSTYYNPYDLADTFIHEFHHNLLYAEEEDGDFLDPAYSDEEAHYSPFRPDSRDLHGVLHACYVFLAATRYWLAMLRAGEADEVRDYAIDRLLRYPLQVKIGMEVLRTRGHFTEKGSALLQRLVREIEELDSGIASLNLPQDAPAVLCEEDGSLVPQRDEKGIAMSVRQSIVEHVRLHDKSGDGWRALETLGL